MPKKKEIGSAKNNYKKISNCQFNKDWRKLYFWIQEVDKDSTKAYCILCNKSFSIQYTAVSNIKRHAISETHIRNENNNSTGNQQLHLNLDETKAVTLSTPGNYILIPFFFTTEHVRN